ARWISWRGYGPFWTRVVRAVRRQDTPPLQLSLEASREPRGVVRGVVRLDARNSSGGYENLLRPAFVVRNGAGAEYTLDARQTAPGTYVADIVLDATAAYDVSVTGVADTPRLVVPANYPDEYRFRPADPAALSALAVS